MLTTMNRSSITAMVSTSYVAGKRLPTMLTCLVIAPGAVPSQIYSAIRCYQSRNGAGSKGSARGNAALQVCLNHFHPLPTKSSVVCLPSSDYQTWARNTRLRKISTRCKRSVSAWRVRWSNVACCSVCMASSIAQIKHRVYICESDAMSLPS